MSVKTIILGAGITGLSAAFFLKKDYKIYEKHSQVGGMAGSIKKNGFTFDFGERFVRIPNEKIKNFLEKLMGDNLFSQNLESRIYFKNKYIRYPFQSHLRELPPNELKKCAKSLFLNYQAKEKTKRSSFDNFEQFIWYEYGDYIANEFMIPYNEKIWSVPPKEMNTSWFLGPNFMPTTNLDKILDSILPNETESNEIPNIRWYPKKGGSQAIADAFLSQISNLNLNIYAQKINLSEKKITFNDGTQENYKHLISTIPLNEFLSIIEDIPEEIKNYIPKLRYNTVFCLHLALDYELQIPYHWIYFPQKDIPFTRLFFSHNFSKNNAPEGKGTCSTLLTYLPDNKIDEKFVIDKTIKTLKSLGYLKSENDILMKLPMYIQYGFTIPTLDLPFISNKIITYLRNMDVYPIGRYGEWKYSGIEHAIEDGEKIAQIIEKKDLSE